MIFQGYEESILEGYFDLTSTIKDSKSIDDFIDDFLKISSLREKENSKESFFSSFFSFFSNINSPYANSLISYLKHEKVNHILLVLPEYFLIQVTDSLYLKNKKIRRPKHKKNFINKLANKFESANIQCSIVWHGTPSNRNNLNTSLINEWLNIEYLKEQLKLGQLEGYLVGLIDTRISSSSNNHAISIIQKDKNFTLRENCSLLIGHDDNLFRYTTANSSNSYIKITNLKVKDKHRIDFTTKNIQEVSSQHQTLNEDYLFNNDYEDFDINPIDLDQEDIIIYFDEAPIVLSKTLYLENADEQQALKTKINLKNIYIVNMKHIATPIKNGLVEVHYFLIKHNSQYLIVGGSRVPKGVNALAKIVVDVEKQTLNITNLSNTALTFENKNGVFAHKATRIIKNNYNGAIASDTEDSGKKIENIYINPSNSYLFSNRVNFDNSSIICSKKSIVVKYSDFKIGSFNTKLELGRDYSKLFKNGNIIDVDQTDKKFGGRVYADGTRNFLGGAISSHPLTLTLEEETFTLTNTIKPSYIVTYSTSKIGKKQLSYGESIKLSDEELFSNKNTIGICNSDGVDVLEVSIIPPGIL